MSTIKFVGDFSGFIDILAHQAIECVIRSLVVARKISGDGHDDRYFSRNLLAS